MKHLSSIFLTIVLFAFSSCKKDDFESDDIGPIVEQDVTFLKHEIVALNVIKDVFVSGQQVCFHDSLFSFNSTDNSIQITKDSLSNLDSMKIKINYGNNLILCKDGKFRSGLIQFSYKKNLSFTDSTNKIKILLNNYRTDTLLINGIQAFTNSGRSNDTLTWQINSSLLMTTNNAKNITFTGNHSIKLKNTQNAFVGYNQPLIFTIAQFLVGGVSSGTNINQASYRSYLSNDVEFGYSCISDTVFSKLLSFTKGYSNYQLIGLISQNNNYIIFGNGDCDKSYMLKSQGFSLIGNFR
jgi:hypothetical protein